MLGLNYMTTGGYTMAKLSAHGYELLRAVREQTFDKDLDYSQNPPVPCELKPYSCVWERETRSHRSDGQILLKRDVRFNDGQKHSYGWKLWKKTKDRSLQGAKDYAHKFAAMVVNGEMKTWKIEYISPEVHQ